MRSSSASSSSRLLFSFFLLASNAEAVRKRREEESTASPAPPARDGRASCGRQTPEERRRLRSLLCGPGSGGPGPGGGLQSPLGAVLLRAVVRRSDQGHADGLLFVSPQRSRRSLRRRATPPAGGRRLDSSINSKLHFAKRKGSQNLSEPGGGGGSDTMLVTDLWRCRTTVMHPIPGVVSLWT